MQTLRTLEVMGGPGEVGVRMPSTTRTAAHRCSLNSCGQFSSSSREGVPLFVFISDMLIVVDVGLLLVGTELAAPCVGLSMIMRLFWLCSHCTVVAKFRGEDIGAEISGLWSAFPDTKPAVGP